MRATLAFNGLNSVNISSENWRWSSSMFLCYFVYYVQPGYGIIFLAVIKALLIEWAFRNSWNELARIFWIFSKYFARHQFLACWTHEKSTIWFFPLDWNITERTTVKFHDMANFKRHLDCSKWQVSMVGTSLL